MKYLSLFSGIEAASVAWEPLGWKPMAFSEIEAFPSAVLQHHYPNVPNLGDVTKVDWNEFEAKHGRPNLIVFGSPCQSFSVAGKRLGLDDPRGNLALYSLSVVNRLRPDWFLFENVPGLLSSGNGRDFGQFLATVGECGYQCAWRILDAQYVRVDGYGRAVPQRRRRVFVVGNSRDWRRAAAVLFERESLSWNHAPRRQAGKGFTVEAAPSLVSSGRGVERTGETRGQDPVVCVPVAPTINAAFGSKLGLENQHIDSGAGMFVAHALRADGFDASEDGTGRGTPLVPVVAASLTRGAESSGKGGYAGRWQEDDANIVAFQTGIEPKGDDSGAAYTLTIPSASGGGQPQAVAFDMRGREGGSQFEGPHDTANIRAASGGSSKSYVAGPWAVRRLMPVECERLQGFPEIRKSVRIEVCEGESIGRAPSAGPGSQARSRDPSAPAVAHVLIDLERSVVEIHRAGRLLWSASTVEPPSSSPLPMPLDAFVRLAAAMTATAAPPIKRGEAASPASISNSSVLWSGSASASVSGREIAALVRDAVKFTETVSNCMRSTTSQSGPNFPNSEPTLETLSCCVVAAISSCIPSEMKQASSYAVIVETVSGYTNITFRGKPAADGPRYKALGNSMACNAMRWLGRRIALVDQLIATLSLKPG